MISSDYVEQSRREYALYVIQHRAIPAGTDGLKPSQRRPLWIARDGKKIKTATLAGATMPIHPHQSPDDAISGLAGPYNNNVPLFSGSGAFGTLLNPKAYGAPRYTSVQTSTFTEDVVFRDIDIIPMTGNYDDTVMEPVHFLPLVPVALLNGVSGIAVGHATNILPHTLQDVVAAQIEALTAGEVTTVPAPNSVTSTGPVVAKTDTLFEFYGIVKIVDTSTARVMELPYGKTHQSFLQLLSELINKGTISNYVDNSSSSVDIEIKFPRGSLKGVAEDQLISTLNLKERHTENITILAFDGQAVIKYDIAKYIKDFTMWRLGWYVDRFKKRREDAMVELQRYLDIRTAATVVKIQDRFKELKTRATMKSILESGGIVNVDYIADLPLYRFTHEELEKNDQKIAKLQSQINEYDELLGSETKRIAVYVAELKDVLEKVNKGVYKLGGM